MAGGGDGSRDELRRRLYAPGATEEDVARYRTAAGPTPPPEPPEPGAADPPPLRPRRRRGAVLAPAGLLAVVAVAVAGIALGGRTDAPAPTTTTRAAAVPVQTTLPVAVLARAAFVRALDAGDDAGLLPFFYENAEARPVAIRTVTRAASREYHGRGAGTIALEPSRLAARSGRVTVLLVLDDVDRFAWRATRVAQTNDRSGPAEQVADRSGLLQPGEIGTATVAYGYGAPTSLQVLVDEDVRWGAVVVFTD